MANTIILDDLSFDQKVSRAPRPVLIDFWAEWCGPCKSIAPVLEELAEEYSGKIDVAKLNVDDFPRIAAGLGVRSIPTMVVFSQGMEKERLVGSYSKSEIRKKIESIL